MLPYPRDPSFPSALKACREMRGMSREDLAKAAGIHKVMPRRYEEPESRDFARPRPESTWLALNKALGFEIPTDIESFISTTESLYTNGIFGSGPIDNKELWDESCVEPTDITMDTLLLKDATLEEIVKLLHSRNIEPTFRHLI